MGTCIYALCRSSLIGVYISWSLSTSSQTLLQKCLFQFKRARHLVTQCFKPKTEVTSYRSYPCLLCLNSHSSLLVAVKVLQASQIPSDVARKFVKQWSAELWKNLSYLWWIFQIWGGCLGLQIAWNHWDCDKLISMLQCLSLIEKKDCGKCTWQSFMAAAFGAVAVVRGGSWQKESLHSLGRECNQLLQGYGLPNSRYIQHPR